MLKTTECLLINPLLMSQISNDAASTRMHEVQLFRLGETPTSAEYELNGQPSPNFLGRKTKCRCYTEANGSYFVEEVCESWTSCVWLFKNRLIWRYTDPTGEYAFVSPISLTKSPEDILERKGFVISSMSAFDAQCITLIKSSTSGRMNGDVFDAVVDGVAVHVLYRSDGFDIENGSKLAMTIKYRVAGSLPPWKHETDSLLREVESGKIPARSLDESFSFESAMSLIAAEDAEEVKIAPEELPNVAQVNGYVLPTGASFSIRSASSSGHGRWLQLSVDSGKKRFECVQYRLLAEWNDMGELANEPISKNTISKSEKFPAGQLMLVSNGKGVAPTTCFIHRSGQTLAITGDFFDDKDFRELIASLRGGRGS